MSTWQLFSDAGADFRWEVAGRALHGKRKDSPNADANQPPRPATRLPSMEDLLLQGCSKLEENNNDDVGRAPMFRTGLGKSVALKQSSIAKALSVLGDDDDAPIRSGCLAGEKRTTGNINGVTNSLFCTGSGKSVSVSPAGLVRAKTLLGLEENNSISSYQGFQNPRKSFDANDSEGQRFSHLTVIEEMTNSEIWDTVPVSGQYIISRPNLEVSNISDIVRSNSYHQEIQNSIPKVPPIKFQTAGGRSLSVSSDALERAKSLLGDPDLGSFLNDENTVDTSVPFSSGNKFNESSSYKATNFRPSFTYPTATKSKIISKTFIPPLRSTGIRIQPSLNSENIILGVDLSNKFDAVDDDKVNESTSTILSKQRSLSNGICRRVTVEQNSLAKESSRSNLPKSSCGPLVDISNTVGVTHHRHSDGERKRLRRGASVSPFKKPRTSKFTTPLRTISNPPSSLSAPSKINCPRRKFSARYPFPTTRVYVKEYFGVPSLYRGMLEKFKNQRCIKSDTAEKYTFYDESGLDYIGAHTLYDMLVQSGASMQYASIEWVINHFKWIVWKLACYERFKSRPRFLTVSNVLEELKYRYEREVNHGHRSAIKRILEGDAQASSMMVLCISRICISYAPKTDTTTLNGSGYNNTGKVELTDGWYSVEAILDEPLSKQLASGKLFVGQKLRIWGAGLCGWDGPVSPLTVLASSTVNLLLHINGTYRAHWADRLGFCKGVGPPLAFRCIKSNGGHVPRTLIGVTRIYPVLYKEKLSNGASIVRSERMEANAVQLYNQRQCAVVEGIVSDFQTGAKASNIYNDSDSEEGAKILKMLETAAEPEVIMAEMSPEQLTSFASYQAKLEATRQLDMEKAIKKALQEASLEEREVTPFMRVRVVGLTNCEGKDLPTKEGLITIWSPNEKQKSELIEGQVYAVTGLLPVNSDSSTLYLQARGSTMKLKSLAPSEIQHFKPFFSPRVPTSISNLGEVPLSSEFDTAAYVIHVGEVSTTAQWKKQWVFVTDGSVSSLKWEEILNSLLAISFCSPYTDEDSFTPINYNLAGSTVGFFNIIKKAKDQMNHLWMAEATENSVYSLNFDMPSCSHLKNSAASVQTWATTSSMIIDRLREKVLHIIGDIKARS